MNDAHEPRVFLVGAGPGNPGLLTVRAVEVLRQADLVLYDQLVPRRLLDYAPPSAERVCVRDLPGTHPDKYPHIHTMLIDYATRGKRVVRLKGGDPLIFGRGAEEAEVLRTAGIPYEIVPGITAALAAASYLEISLTHRRYSSAVALVTGHEVPTKPGQKLDWNALAAFPGTLAIYMGVARLPLIVAELLKYGKDPNTPAAIVERASTGEMRSVYAPLSELEQARRNEGLEAPGLILVGEAVSHRPERSWFEQRPLFGKRVLVTRPKHQALEMIEQLEELGAVTSRLPTLQIRPVSDPSALDRALEQVRQGQWDWLVFTSANGVTAFLDRLREQGQDWRALAPVKIAAIGPKTADTLLKYHLVADLVPDTAYSSEGLVESLIPHVQGRRVLLARANRGRDVLPKELARVATVEQVTVYEQHDGVDIESEAYAALRRGEIGYVMLTSSNIARGLIAACDETILGRIQRGDTRLIAISPETARVVQELGCPVAAVAREYTATGMLDALRELVTRETRGVELSGDPGER